MGVKRQLKKALSAEQIEKNNKKLIEDYHEFMEFSGSELLKEYSDLEKFVNSQEFISKKKKTESLSFRGSSFWKKEKVYKKLSSYKSLKAYLKLEGSRELDDFNAFKSSALLKEYSDLEAELKSPGLDKEDYKQNVKKYKELRKHPDIKAYYKFLNSKSYKFYESVKDSDLLDQYNELSKYISSQEFKKEKEFLLNKNRFLTTPEYQKAERFNQLKSREDIKKYLSYKGSDAFESLKEWELSFEDDFTSSCLDDTKWINRYHSGNELLGSNYSLEGDKHFFTEGDNIDIQNSCLKIVSREEKIVGKQWNGVLGFREQEFDYTSGIVTTGNKFRQKYGRFEAKVKVSGMPVRHCFWLMSDFAAPHIDVFKTLSGKELVTSVFSDVDKGFVNRLKGVDFSKDFFIYSLIWEPGKIEWRINNITVWEQRENIPHEPMFVSLGTCIYDDLKGGSLPSVMEVDWVRCYKKSQ